MSLSGHHSPLSGPMAPRMGERGLTSPSGQQGNDDSSPQGQEDVPYSVGHAIAKRRDGALGGFLNGGKRRCRSSGASTYAEQNPGVHLEQPMTNQDADQVWDVEP